MSSKPTLSGSNRRTEKEAVSDDHDQPSVPDQGMRQDMSMFIWQRLSDIDTRMTALIEKYGRLDGRIGEVQVLIQGTSEKVGNIEGKINIVHGVFIATGVVIAASWAIFQFVVPHLSWK